VRRHTVYIQKVAVEFTILRRRGAMEFGVVSDGIALHGSLCHRFRALVWYFGLVLWFGTCVCVR